MIGVGLWALVLGLWSLVSGFWFLDSRMELSSGKTNFEKLRIYELSEELSDLVWRIVNNWGHLAKSTVGSQIVRSVESIGANIAEGSGRGTDKEYVRFLRIARGSLYETRHWLRSAYRKELLAKENVEEVKLLIGELTPKLNSYISAIQKPKSQDQRPKSQDQSPFL